MSAAKPTLVSKFDGALRQSFSLAAGGIAMLTGENAASVAAHAGVAYDQWRMAARFGLV